jgi:hypothetical protein
MSKSDVSKPRASDASNQIVLTFEDVLPENSDATIKIKKVSEFLGADVTQLKIVGENISYVHNDVTHHELTFVIKDKKTKVVDKLVIDFVQKPNQKKFKGVVSLATDAASSAAAIQRKCSGCECPGHCKVDQGDQAFAVYSSGPVTIKTACDPVNGGTGCVVPYYRMAITLTSIAPKR